MSCRTPRTRLLPHEPPTQVTNRCDGNNKKPSLGLGIGYLNPNSLASTSTIYMLPSCLTTLAPSRPCRLSSDILVTEYAFCFLL